MDEKYIFQEETKMRKSKMWRMLTVAAVAASMTCGVFGVQSVSAADKKTLKVAMECGYKNKRRRLNIRIF